MNADTKTNMHTRQKTPKKAATQATQNTQNTQNNLVKFHTQWDLKRYFYKDTKDAKLFERWEYIKKQAKSLAQKYKNINFAKNPEKVLEYFTDSDAVFAEIGEGGKPLVFLWLAENLNTKDAKVKQLQNKLVQEYVDFIAPIQQIEVKISRLPVAILQKVLKIALEHDKYKKYKFAIELIIRRRKHVLHPKQEEVLLRISPITAKWTELTEQWLTQQYIIDNYHKNKKPRRLTLSQISPILRRNNLEYISFIDKKLAKKHKRAAYMATKELNAILLDKWTKAKMRKYKDTLEPRLLSARVERSTIEALLAQAQKNFKTAHIYYEKVKNRFAQLYNKPVVLGYEHRVALPFKEQFEEEANNQPHRASQNLDSSRWHFETSVNFMTNLLRQIDKDAHEYFLDMLDGRIDVYPKPAKTGGAFSMGVNNKNIPEFILLNYNNAVDDMFTLAHELGHSFHSFMAKKHQPYVYWDYPLTVAEFASTFLETVTILTYMLQADPKELQKHLYTWAVDMVSTVYRQLALFMFELEMHEQFAKLQYLDTKHINKIFRKHMTAYLGPAVKFRKHHELAWVGWPHIRMPFYVFTYAFGALAAYSLLKDFVAQVLKELKNSGGNTGNMGKSVDQVTLPDSLLTSLKQAFAKYKSILASGNSATTERIFEKAGLNVSTQEFWADAFKLPELLVGMLAG